MKLNGLALLYENIEVISTIIVLSIVFFIFLDKKNNQRNLSQNDEQTNDFKEKWYDVSQMDIISSKVGILSLAILALIYIIAFKI